MARVVALQELVHVLRDNLLDPKKQSERLARVARTKLKEVEAKQGVHPTTKYVDGRKGAAEETVRPDGTIVYLIHPFTQFIDELLVELQRRSPYGPAKEGAGYRGMHYQDVWKILVNGVPEAAFSGRKPQPGETWTVINTMPYAKVIGHGWSAQAPPLWIDDVARDFQRKYGNLFGGVTVGGKNLKGFEYNFIVPPEAIMPPGSKRYGDGRLPAIIVRVPGNAVTL